MTFSVKETGQPDETIPALAGIGLKGKHFADVLTRKPAVGWFEVHAENYMGPDHLGLQRLETIRKDYGISVHGVGLSLGTSAPLDQEHLGRLKRLVSRLDPMLVSEHLSWSSFGGHFLNDLLPLPYTVEALEAVAKNVDVTQHALGRKILVENPSIYVSPASPEMDEIEFFTELVRRTGCGILLDVNNVFVTASNTGTDTGDYLRRIPAPAVEEIHLAGHSRREVEGKTILIDDHGSPVAEPVWALFETALARIGPRRTLIEWDTNPPSLETLDGEAEKAKQILADKFSGEKRRVYA